MAATDQTLVVTANACITFNYQTCQGFFCSLCTTLSVTTDFIANQLDTAEALCVSAGQDGTVVGQDAPQVSFPLAELPVACMCETAGLV